MTCFRLLIKVPNLSVLLALLVLWHPQAARADSIVDYYKGKTFTIFIGYPPGGSYDLNARAIARTLGSKIPGNPNVIVQNMPGAGSLSAANHVGNIAAQDGLAIAAVGAALPFAPMLDPNGARFDATKINWMPSPAPFVALMTVWHTSPRYLVVDASSDTFKGWALKDSACTVF